MKKNIGENESGIDNPVTGAGSGAIGVRMESSKSPLVEKVKPEEKSVVTTNWPIFILDDFLLFHRSLGSHQR